MTSMDEAPPKPEIDALIVPAPVIDALPYTSPLSNEIIQSPVLANVSPEAESVSVAEPAVTDAVNFL